MTRRGARNLFCRSVVKGCSQYSCMILGFSCCRVGCARRCVFLYFVKGSTTREDRASPSEEIALYSVMSLPKSLPPSGPTMQETHKVSSPPQLCLSPSRKNRYQGPNPVPHQAPALAARSQLRSTLTHGAPNIGTNKVRQTQANSPLRKENRHIVQPNAPNGNVIGFQKA